MAVMRAVVKNHAREKHHQNQKNPKHHTKQHHTTTTFTKQTRSFIFADVIHITTTTTLFLFSLSLSLGFLFVLFVVFRIWYEHCCFSSSARFSSSCALSFFVLSSCLFSWLADNCQQMYIFKEMKKTRGRWIAAGATSIALGAGIFPFVYVTYRNNERAEKYGKDPVAAAAAAEKAQK